MRISGNDYASHISKHLAGLHAAALAEPDLNRERADRLIQITLQEIERQTWERIQQADRGDAEILPFVKKR